MNESIKNEIIIIVFSSVILGSLVYFKNILFKIIKNIYYNFKKNKKTDALLIIIYRRKGGSVDLDYLKKEFNLSQIEIINRLEKAKKQELVINNPVFNKQYDWSLTPKGEKYIEDLLE